MTSAERATYLDSSAIVKLVVVEPETAALRAHLRRGRHRLVSSGLARTEVVRASVPSGDAAVEAAHRALGELDLVRVNDRVLRAAGTIGGPGLRSLDAIHLATAVMLGSSVSRLCTYDLRMAEAAEALGFTVVAPD
jgi:predicted nucleic acid-binding protein